MQGKNQTEMVKLNRIKYARSDEEMQQLKKEGYTVASAGMKQEAVPEGEGLKEKADSTAPAEDGESISPEEEKPAGKRGDKKK